MSSPAAFSAGIHIQAWFSSRLARPDSRLAGRSVGVAQVHTVDAAGARSGSGFAIVRVSSFRLDEEFARELDAKDPLKRFRDRFELPDAASGEPRVYLLGNSLGPLPGGVRAALDSELNAWASRGVESYFQPPASWSGLDVRHREAMATIVGAAPHEVGLMNGLTVNLHLLFASFYQPQETRTKVLIERPCFPSDRYVVDTQIQWRGSDPARDIIEVGEGDHGPVTAEAIERVLDERGPEIAVVFLSGVNFLTGELLDMPRIAKAAHAAGCVVGFDLAHAVGNVPVSLHDWEIDFAAWCTYKYLNAGPGAVAGMFVHDSHASDPHRIRLGGWWGNEPDSRFRWQQTDDFVPRGGAVGWQLSCPSVLSLAPIGPALDLLLEAGMTRIREKSMLITGYLEWILQQLIGPELRVITPSDPNRRGAQLSLLVHDARRLKSALAAKRIDVDVREPDVVRLAPAPMFNTYHEVWRAAHLVARHLNLEER
ncbi:MAG: kynureninase [Gemmatimonadales bacterium]|nr:MAG: kynureninase [Gemmatimonadales bacterium]